MFTTLKPLILASGSPRRKQFLHDLGLEFEIQTSNVEENLIQGELPEAFVTRMAREKAGAVMKHYHGGWVVAADTVVCIDDHIFGKPDSKEAAVQMLLQLAGREHTVATGFCLGNHDAAVEATRSVSTSVTFFPFTRDIAMRYVATGEPLDKAGAYGIQGKGAFLVEKLSGSYTNVVGLPMTEVVQMLCQHGVISASAVDGWG